jgi:cytochrome c-type biogenesis protein CcmH/NrfG
VLFRSPPGKAAAKAAAAAEAERAKSLRAKANDLEAQAKLAFDAADKDFDQAFVVLSAASKAHPDSAAVALAAGFYYARDASVSGTGEEMLARAVELRLGHQSSLDLANPPDGLTAFLRAALWGHQPGERKRVRDALTAALTKDPTLQRARLELALELDRAGDRDGGRKLLKELLGAVPNHTRALAVLASWDVPPPPSAVTAAPPPADDAATAPKAKKKKKGKRTK